MASSKNIKDRGSSQLGGIINTVVAHFDDYYISNRFLVDECHCFGCYLLP
jgi:hypothetical protein